MEVGDKLKELNLTEDEIERFSKAFKDDKFREMLHDYAKEISDPDNRKIYEEEIKLLEQERGFSIEFIQPTPFKVIKTSVAGKQKCFINICSNEKIGKPKSKFAVSEDGRRGQHWSLPYIMHSARQDTDPKGIKFMIYDVIFHPDTLHIASKNKTFMDMVTDTAIQGIHEGFKVMLDKNNVREMRTKYKGVLQPCVIRKPIPGYEAKEPAEHQDPLAFLHQDDAPPQKKPVESPLSNNSFVNPLSFQIQPQKAKEPTKPNYTVKYRSVIDLQDFRCCRDFAKSPRPKEIVVTIDLPLLRSVRDTDLEVKEKSLLLESKSPAYRLELPLAYPVDEEKGEAKFNKQRGQLTVTLPIHPLNVAFDFFVGPATSESDSKSDGESQEERSAFEEEDTCKEGEGMKREKVEQIGVEMNEAEESHMEKRETRAEKGDEEEESYEEKEEQGQKGEEKEETGTEQEKKDRQSKEKEIGLNVQKSDTIPESEVNKKVEKLKEQVNKENVGQLTMQDKQNKGNENYNKTKECDTSAGSMDSWKAGDTSILKTGISNVVISNRSEASPKTEKQHILRNEQSSFLRQKKESNPTASASQSLPKLKCSEEETETTKHIQGNMQVETDAALQNDSSSEVSFDPATSARAQKYDKDVCISEGGVVSRKMSATDPARELAICSAGPTSDSDKHMDKEDLDEDDLQTEQIFQASGDDNKPPPALLREIDADGTETVISDHSTSAGFNFQNKLMYELD